ncbi:MAG: VapE domain-containing protein [Gammaproteobacteria bacterium]
MINQTHSADKLNNLLENGYEAIPCNGKAPISSGWASENHDLHNPPPSNWTGTNIGIRTGQGAIPIYAVDIDIYDTDVSEEILRSGLNTLGLSPIRTGLAPKVMLFYRGDVGCKKIQRKWKDSAGKTHGVEILGHGQQFIAEGIHPVTEAPYTWDRGTIHDMPAMKITEVKHHDITAWLDSIIVPVDWVEIGKKPLPVQIDASTGEMIDYVPQITYSDADITKTIKRVLDKLGKVSEGDRNNQLNMSAFNLFGLLHAADKVSLIDEVRAKLHQTALNIGLDEDEVSNTLDSAMKASPKWKPSHPVFPHCKKNKSGESILTTRENLEALMAFYNVDARYDVIKLRPNITNIKSLQGEEENSLIAELKSKCGLHGLDKGVVDDQLSVIMRDNAHNPVTTWLENIQRSSEHNPINELVDSLPVENQAWARVAFYRWFIQCVAAADRAVQTPNKEALPKFESVLTFYGGQGLKKTAFIRSLLPKALKSYLKDGISLDLANKDSKTEALSAWITELGELDATFKRSDISAIKAFLSRQEDEIRRPYARAATIMPRQTSFFGSVNEERFLRDETGNRRYLPVTVMDELNIPDGFDCIDMWAFIWQEYLQGEQWWLTKEEEVLQKTALKAHEDNSLEDLIRDAFDFDLDLPKGHNLTTQDILKSLHQRVNRGSQTRIGNTLKKMGIEKEGRDYLMPPYRDTFISYRY